MVGVGDGVEVGVAVGGMGVEVGVYVARLTGGGGVGGTWVVVGLACWGNLTTPAGIV
jgi:hypothetical protein